MPYNTMRGSSLHNTIRNAISSQANLGQGQLRGHQAYTSQFMRGNPWQSPSFNPQPMMFQPSFQLQVKHPPPMPPTTPVQPDAATIQQQPYGGYF